MITQQLTLVLLCAGFSSDQSVMPPAPTATVAAPAPTERVLFSLSRDEVPEPLPTTVTQQAPSEKHKSHTSQTSNVTSNSSELADRSGVSQGDIAQPFPTMNFPEAMGGMVHASKPERVADPHLEVYLVQALRSSNRGERLQAIQTLGEGTIVSPVVLVALENVRTSDISIRNRFAAAKALRQLRSQAVLISGKPVAAVPPIHIERKPFERNGWRYEPKWFQHQYLPRQVGLPGESIANRETLLSLPHYNQGYLLFPTFR